MLNLALLASHKRNNFEQRRVTARIFGYKKEMLFTSHAIGINNTPCTWTANWTEFPITNCPKCASSLDVNETFEIIIDMGSTVPLKQGQESVLRHLSNLWETKNLADITFKCGDRDIKAHTLIVSSGSPVLAAMFQNDFIEKQERSATIKETRGDVFEKLLYFIYTGDFDYEFHNIAALLIAADMYNVIPLKEKCEQHLSKNVTLEEATNFLILSHLQNAKELYKATLNFMQQNAFSRTKFPNLISTLPLYFSLAIPFFFSST